MNSTILSKTLPIIKKVLPERLYINAKTGFSRFAWTLDRGVAPPSGVKIQWIRHFQKKYRINTMVETGTCRGDMISAVRNDFSQIYSIELSEQLHNNARKRFAAFPKVRLLCGSSDQVLSRLLPAINERCLFWLDAHYSGGNTSKGDLECPILGELAAVKHHHVKNHVLLIDDARCFDGTSDYPTLKRVESIISEINSEYSVDSKDNIIMACTPS